MTNLKFRRPNSGDVVYLAEHMRESDVHEFRCIVPQGPLWAVLVWCIDNSDESLVALVDDVPVAIFGCGKTDLGGVPWMAATPSLNNLKLTTLRNVRAVINAWLDHYGHLYNDVHKDNHASQGMLRWLGFTIEPSSDFHPEFQRFWKKKGN